MTLTLLYKMFMVDATISKIISKYITFICSCLKILKHLLKTVPRRF